jgi:hypothetical protein
MTHRIVRPDTGGLTVTGAASGGFGREGFGSRRGVGGGVRMIFGAAGGGVVRFGSTSLGWFGPGRDSTVRKTTGTSPVALPCGRRHNQHIV